MVSRQTGCGQPWVQAAGVQAACQHLSCGRAPSQVTAVGTCDQVLVPWVLGTCRSGLAAPGTTVAGGHKGEARKTFHNFIRRERETPRGAPAPQGPSGNQTKWLLFCVLRPHV